MSHILSKQTNQFKNNERWGLWVEGSGKWFDDRKITCIRNFEQGLEEGEAFEVTVMNFPILETNYVHSEIN